MKNQNFMRSGFFFIGNMPIIKQILLTKKPVMFFDEMLSCFFRNSDAKFNIMNAKSYRPPFEKHTNQ